MISSLTTKSFLTSFKVIEVFKLTNTIATHLEIISSYSVNILTITLRKIPLPSP